MFRNILSVLVFVTSASAFAADGISESSNKTILDDFYVNLSSTLHGPGVTNTDKPYTPNADGKTVAKPTNLMNFDSEIVTAYMFNKDMGIGPDIPFYAYPVMGKGISLGDVGIKAFDRHFYSDHDLAVYAGLILQLPTNDYSSSRQMKLGVKATPAIRYIIPNTRVTLGSFTEEKAYLGVNAGKTLKLWALPYVNYQVTPNFSWNLGFEAEADHFYGKPNFDLTMYQTDIMPGFVYVFSPKFIVNPYFQVFTSQKVSINNTALGAYLSASL